MRNIRMPRFAQLLIFEQGEAPTRRGQDNTDRVLDARPRYRVFEAVQKEAGFLPYIAEDLV
jgi:hypothetical protein